MRRFNSRSAVAAVERWKRLWPLTNAALINQHFASIEDLEDAQFARCTALQRRPDLIRSTTCFHWWPKHIAKRRGPRRN